MGFGRGQGTPEGGRRIIEGEGWGREGDVEGEVVRAGVGVVDVGRGEGEMGEGGWGGEEMVEEGVTGWVEGGGEAGKH